MGEATMLSAEAYQQTLRRGLYFKPRREQFMVERGQGNMVNEGLLDDLCCNVCDIKRRSDSRRFVEQGGLCSHAVSC